MRNAPHVVRHYGWLRCELSFTVVSWWFVVLFGIAACAGDEARRRIVAGVAVGARVGPGASGLPLVSLCGQG
jgi:hypothetical protein